MTLLYRDEVFLKHDTGRHPECAARLRAVHAHLDKTGLIDRCRPGKFQSFPEEDLVWVHDPAVGSSARRMAQAGGGHLDADTVVCPESHDVALAAAGACVAAVDAVLDGEDKTALCLVRPPGHHATPKHSMGFCLFNNMALAARRALRRGLSRVLVLDWDVHHGNGTQDIFYDDPQVTFVSIHRHGHGFYPGTGDADETGTGAGLGHTFNAPIAFGTSRQGFHDAYRQTLQAAVAICKPELVLVSAGFDAHTLDPIGSLGLEVEDFITLTREVLDVARTHSGGRLVSFLEGGYHLDALAQSVGAHLQTLLEAAP